jgi:subtilisin family serine protease
MIELHKCLERYELTQAHKQEPVRIAVIDTGVYIDDITLETQFDSRLEECRSWLDAKAGEGGTLLSPGNDEDGHGTHTVSIALQATRQTRCKVYAAQVFQKRQDKGTVATTESIQVAIARVSFHDKRQFSLLLADVFKAIKYAVEQWRVDIISMSFGYESSVPCIETEIANAYSQRKLMFAAASNSGGNADTAWPARCSSVIPVYATDGVGNKYDRNPTPDDRGEHLAVVGMSLKGCWLPNDKGFTQYKHRSGTSGATPVAAGIAGAVISLMRKEKADYLYHQDESLPECESLLYDRCLAALETPNGMKAVFRLMSKRKRDGYDYVDPCFLLDQKYKWQAVYDIFKRLGSL